MFRVYIYLLSDILLQMKYSIELIRLVAVLLITFTHTKHTLSTNDWAYFFVEILPPYGTAILSVISGYLYWETGRKKESIWRNKVKSLAIPYLLANLLVLIPIIILHFLGHDLLNRLTYDYTLITEGLLSLNSPPINPPTYFIRDIFVIFLIIELIQYRNFCTLLVLVPLVMFGQLVLRYDIFLLFLFGMMYGGLKNQIDKSIWLSVLGVVTSLWVLFGDIDYLRIPVACILFIVLLDWSIKFIEVGAYTYLLHLFHSPIMVVTSVILGKYSVSNLPSITIQIILSICLAYVIYWCTKRIPFLRVLTGGR